MKCGFILLNEQWIINSEQLRLRRASRLAFQLAIDVLFKIPLYKQMGYLT